VDIGNDTRVDAEPHGRPFQFSLRTMFIVTTIVAVWCSGLFAPYAWARLLTLAIWVFTVPVVLIVMVIYARGYIRTFAIGGLFTTFPLLVFHIIVAYAAVALAFSGDSNSTDWSGFLAMDDNADQSRFAPGICCTVYTAVVFLFGFLAMGVRWMVESPQRTRAPRATIEPPHDIREFAMSSPTQELENDPG